MATLRNVETPDRGVILLDGNLWITYANKRAAEIFGISISELISSELPHGIANRPVSPEEIVDEVLESFSDLSVTIHRYSTPIYSSDRKVAGRVEIYSDITARRELEKEILDRNVELAELNRQLEDAQEQLIQSERLRALGEMAAGVAHDINNVLGIILGNAQLAKRKADPDSSVAQSLGAIEMAARDAADTVRRLREIGKPIDTSTYQAVDLSEIVEDVVGSVFPAWRESGSHGAEITVETDLQPGCVVLGNATELREALANLLLNAAQSIDTCGRIDLSTSRDGFYTELRVRDTGAGMNEETRKRLFDPFFTTRGAEGTGLGMSMVDAIAIRHRGKVLVESEEDKGTMITLRLPAVGIRL